MLFWFVAAGCELTDAEDDFNGDGGGGRAARDVFWESCADGGSGIAGLRFAPVSGTLVLRSRLTSGGGASFANEGSGYA